MAVVVQILALQIQLGRMGGDATRAMGRRVERGTQGTSPISGASGFHGEGEMCCLGIGSKGEYSGRLNFIFIKYRTV